MRQYAVGGFEPLYEPENQRPQTKYTPLAKTLKEMVRVIISTARSADSQDDNVAE